MKKLTENAPTLVPVLFNGPVWRSHVAQDGFRCVNYYLKPLLLTAEPVPIFVYIVVWFVCRGQSFGGGGVQGFLTIRTDRDRYFYGLDELLAQYSDIMIKQAENAAPSCPSSSTASSGARASPETASGA